MDTLQSSDKISLAGCAILNENTILLLHRSKTDWYELPGGKIDAGESAETAAVHELQEELLCSVSIVRKLGQQDFEENGYRIEYIWFLAEIQAGQSPRLGEPDKFSDFKYVALKDLSTHKLSPNMQNFAQAITSGQVKLD